MIKIKKILLVSLSMVLFLSTFLISCNSNNKDINEENTTTMQTEKSPPRNEVSGELKVHFLNLESAECILVQQGEENMIIDAGNEVNEETLKNYLSKNNISEFKYAIATHPHNNHIGSMDFIVDNYKINNFFAPQVTNTTKAYNNLISSLYNKNLNIVQPKVGEVFELGQAKITILGPNSTKYEDINNYSIVVKLEFGNNSFLFTGDSKGISESEMILSDIELKSDVLKVSNSGGKSATSTEFLNNVNPDYAIISVGANNEYGYPHKETLDKLDNNNIKVYRTDESGTIIATSDGNDISFSTKFNDNNQ